MSDLAAGTTIAAPGQPECRPKWLSDLWRLGVILLLTVSTRSWVVVHTEVLSRDSLPFIRFALQIEHPLAVDALNPAEGTTRLDVVKHTFQPPGYSLALLAVSWPVRAALGGTTCEAMVLSAQLTSVLSALLLVFPAYFLGKLLFDRQTAFVGTMLFQVLPVFTSISSDGLSDSLFLLMAVTSLWFMAVGFRRQSSCWFLAAGMASGLAYLVRPEGLVVVLASGLVLLGGLLAGKLNWWSMLIRGAMIGTGLLLTGGPYVAMIGGLTNKPTVLDLGHLIEGQDVKPSWKASAEPTATNVLLAEWKRDTDLGKWLWAGRALAMELMKTSFYATPFFALVGLWALRRRLLDDPPLTLFVVCAGCQIALLLVLGSGAGYIAGRHTLLIVFCSCFFAAASFPVLGRCYARLGLGSEAFWSALIAVAFIAASVPASMKALHANRAPHRAAGLWLANQLQWDDMLVDPFSWAEYYAGYITAPPDDHPLVRRVFVVVEDPQANPHPRLHLMKTAHAIAHRGELVYHWPENKPLKEAKVFVYLWDPAKPLTQRDRATR